MTNIHATEAAQAGKVSEAAAKLSAQAAKTAMKEQAKADKETIAAKAGHIGDVVKEKAAGALDAIAAGAQNLSAKLK